MLIRCPHCKRKKRPARFHKSASAWDGVSSYCKACTKERTQSYRKKHPIRVARSERAWRQKHPINMMLIQARKSARSRKLKFNLTLAHLKTLVVDKCPILGVLLMYGTCVGHASSNAASVDRLDSSKGYVIGNVSIISYRANLIKNDGTAKEHRLIAEFMESRQ